MKQKLTIISLDFWVDVAKNRWAIYLVYKTLKFAVS